MDNQENNNNEGDKKECELLKQEIEKIRTDYNNAKHLLTNVQNFSDQFKGLNDLLKEEKNKVSLSAEFIEDEKKKIDEFKNQSQDTLNELTENLKKVEDNIKVMQTSYAEFSEIKGKITGVDGEINELLNSSRNLKVDIETAKNEAQKSLDSIKNTFNEVQGEIEKMQNAYSEFSEIKKKIDNEDTGLDAIFNEVQKIHKQSNNLKKEIIEFGDESKEALNIIKSNKESTNKLKNDIEKNLIQSNVHKKEIEKVTNLVNDTGFASAFHKRANILQDGYVSWKKIFIYAVVALAIFVFILFSKDLGSGQIPELKNTLYRLSLTSPILFLIGFSMKQYGKERDLNEKYAFKATTATVIRNHIEFLLERFDNEQEVVKFVIETFRTIYKEPYNKDIFDNFNKKLIREIKKNKSSAFSFGDNDINEVVNSVKELTTLIPNDNTLKDLLSLFNRLK